MNHNMLIAFFDEVEKIGQGGMMGERLSKGGTSPAAQASIQNMVSGGGLAGGGSGGAGQGASAGGAMGSAMGAGMAGGPAAAGVGGGAALGAGLGSQSSSAGTANSGESQLGSAAKRPSAADLGI